MQADLITSCHGIIAVLRVMVSWRHAASCRSLVLQSHGVMLQCYIMSRSSAAVSWRHAASCSGLVSLSCVTVLCVEVSQHYAAVPYHVAVSCYKNNLAWVLNNSATKFHDPSLNVRLGDSMLSADHDTEFFVAKHF